MVKCYEGPADVLCELQPGQCRRIRFTARVHREGGLDLDLIVKPPCTQLAITQLLFMAADLNIIAYMDDTRAALLELAPVIIAVMPHLREGKMTWTLPIMSPKRLLSAHPDQIPTEEKIVLLVDVGMSVVALHETVVLGVKVGRDALAEHHVSRGGTQGMVGERLARSLVLMPGK